MYQPYPAPGFGDHEAVQHLLQLAGDGASVPQARGLIDDHVDAGSFLLPGQHLDGGVGVRQRGRLRCCDHQHHRGQRHGKQHHVRNARAGIQQHHVVVRNQAADNAQEIVTHFRRKARIFHHAGAGQQHRETTRCTDDRLLQFGLAGEHVMQCDLGIKVQHHVQVGQPEIGIQYQHALPAFGQRGRQVGRDKSLADTAFATGDGNYLAERAQRYRGRHRFVGGGIRCIGHQFTPRTALAAGSTATRSIQAGSPMDKWPNKRFFSSALTAMTG